MDNYPDHLSPHHWPNVYEREPFAEWWNRTQGHWSSVPKNAARTWIWNHWHRSGFGWLPSAGAQFTLECWSPSEVSNIAIWRSSTAVYTEWGDTLLDGAQRPLVARNRLAAIMTRRGRWPAPPIVLERLAPLPFESPHDDFPAGYMLLEGNNRLAMALALERRGALKGPLSLWVLRYTAA